MIGEKITFEDIPEDGMIKVGKKKVMWWDYYLFTEEQEKQWREWCKEKAKDCLIPVDMFKVDMVYGFRTRYKKEGDLL